MYFIVFWEAFIVKGQQLSCILIVPVIEMSSRTLLVILALQLSQMILLKFGRNTLIHSNWFFCDICLVLEKYVIEWATSSIIKELIGK